MRDTFVATTTALLDEDPRTALVLADISGDAFAPARRRHPDRVLNVGIREQLMTGVAGGLALTGLRPYVHSYAPFAVDRAYEQIKLDLGPPGRRARCWSASAPRTTRRPRATPTSRRATSRCWTRSTAGPCTCPATRDEVAPLLRRRRDRPTTGSTCGCPTQREQPGVRRTRRAAGDAAGLGRRAGGAWRSGRCSTRCWRPPRTWTSRWRTRRRRGRSTPRGCGRLVSREVVLVEPYLAGTSSRLVAAALADVPHRGAAPRGGPRRGAPLRHAGRPRALARPGRGRPARLDQRVPAGEAVARPLRRPGPERVCGRSRKTCLSSASKCHTCSGSASRIRNRSRTPSTAVAAISTADGPQVRAPGDVAQVPQVGVQVQPQAVQHPGLLGHHQPAVGQQQQELAGQRRVRTHAAGHQHGGVVGLHAAAEDRHVPAHGRDRRRRLRRRRGGTYGRTRPCGV